MKPHVTLELTKKELDVIAKLNQEQGLTFEQVLRQSLRLYQLVDTNIKNGNEMLFRNSQTKKVIEPKVFGCPDLDS